MNSASVGLFGVVFNLVTMLALGSAGPVAASPLERDYTFSDARLHGDGSITFDNPRRLFNGEFARVDLRSAENLCAAMGFRGSYVARGVRPLYGSYRAVQVDQLGAVTLVDECTEVVRSIRCVPDGTPVGPVRPLLQ